MAITFIAGGYGGYATIGGKSVFLTSYGLSMSTNFIESSASGRIWDNAQNKFGRLSLSGYRDFAGYDLSLSFEATRESFNYLLDRIVNHPHVPIPVVFKDVNYTLEYSFEQAYISKVTFSFNTDGACEINADFLVCKRTVEVCPPSNVVNNQINPQGEYLAGETLLPYYFFGIEYDDDNIGIDGLVSFSLTLEQQIEKKFGCVGFASDNCPEEPMYLVFGKMNGSYSITYLYKRDNSNSESNESNSGSGSNGIGAVTNVNCLAQERNIVVKYKGAVILQCGKAFAETYVPNVAQKSGYNTVQIDGAIFGGVEFQPIVQ